jgi:hypothetical protein
MYLANLGLLKILIAMRFSPFVAQALLLPVIAACTYLALRWLVFRNQPHRGLS